MCQMHDVTAIKTFVCAGNATFTLKSCVSGKHFTYRAKKSPNNKSITFVSLLNGPNNQADFAYIGILQNGEFRTTSKSCAGDDALSVKAMKFFSHKVMVEGKDLTYLSLEFMHEGRCGRCNRTLTVPESIEAGIGPECAGKIGI